jgi:phage-related tail protein
MSNYNEEFLNGLKKLKNSVEKIENFSNVFEKLETMANKHIEINNSFKENLEHLNEYNEEFSELNDAIRKNILDLKETALKFPEQLTNLQDKTQKAIVENTNKITNNQKDNMRIFVKKFEDLSEMVSNLKIIIITLLLANFSIIGLLIYNIFLK